MTSTEQIIFEALYLLSRGVRSMSIHILGSYPFEDTFEETVEALLPELLELSSLVQNTIHHATSNPAIVSTYPTFDIYLVNTGDGEVAVRLELYASSSIREAQRWILSQPREMPSSVAQVLQGVLLGYSPAAIHGFIGHLHNIFDDFPARTTNFQSLYRVSYDELEGSQVSENDEHWV